MINALSSWLRGLRYAGCVTTSLLRISICLVVGWLLFLVAVRDSAGASAQWIAHVEPLCQSDRSVQTNAAGEFIEREPIFYLAFVAIAIETDRDVQFFAQVGHIQGKAFIVYAEAKFNSIANKDEQDVLIPIEVPVDWPVTVIVESLPLPPVFTSTALWDDCDFVEEEEKE